MSILPVIPLVQEFNKNKPGIFETSEKYKNTEQDKALHDRIVHALRMMRLPYTVTLMIEKTSGQLHLKCEYEAQKRNSRSLTLPPIKAEAKKV